MIPITWISAGKRALSLFTSPVTWLVLFATVTVILWFAWRGAVADLRASKLECQTIAAEARAAALEEAEEFRRFIQNAQQDALGELATRLAIVTKAAEHWRARYEEAKRDSESPCAVQAQAILQCPLD